MKDGYDHQGGIFKAPDQPPYIIDKYACRYEKCEVGIVICLIEYKKCVSEENRADDKERYRSGKYRQQFIRKWVS